jgi:NAD(P)H-flavin reductase
MPDIGDVIELTADIPDRNLRAGLQGTIVHCHDHEAYEVEFTEDGEPLDFLALRAGQFIVVWRAETQEWFSGLHHQR